MGTRESYCFHHVQAIKLTIDQYAESALEIRTQSDNSDDRAG
jgi:hypothetical protein